MVTNDPVIQHNTTRVTYLIYSSSTLEARERNPSSCHTMLCFWKARGPYIFYNSIIIFCEYVHL